MHVNQLHILETVRVFEAQIRGLNGFFLAIIDKHGDYILK